MEGAARAGHEQDRRRGLGGRPAGGADLVRAAADPRAERPDRVLFGGATPKSTAGVPLTPRSAAGSGGSCESRTRWSRASPTDRVACLQVRRAGRYAAARPGDVRAGLDVAAGDARGEFGREVPRLRPPVVVGPAEVLEDAEQFVCLREGEQGQSRFVRFGHAGCGMDEFVHAGRNGCRPSGLRPATSPGRGLCRRHVLWAGTAPYVRPGPVLVARRCRHKPSAASPEPPHGSGRAGAASRGDRQRRPRR